MSDWNDQFAVKGEDGVYRPRRVAVAASDNTDPCDDYPEQPEIVDDDSCCGGSDLPHDLPSYRALEERQIRLTYEIDARKRLMEHLRSTSIAKCVLAKARRKLKRDMLDLQETERQMEMLLN
jgi:hypothetical protein